MGRWVSDVPCLSDFVVGIKPWVAWREVEAGPFGSELKERERSPITHKESGYYKGAGCFPRNPGASFPFRDLKARRVPIVRVL
jgi:hypothetical protein